MTSKSNNTGVLEFGQVAAPIVIAQAPGPVSVSLGEKLEKFN